MKQLLLVSLILSMELSAVKDDYADFEPKKTQFNMRRSFEKKIELRKQARKRYQAKKRLSKLLSNVAAANEITSR